MNGVVDHLTAERVSERATQITSPAAATILGAVVVAVVLLAILVLLIRVVRTARHLHELSREGRHASASQHGSNPVTSFNRSGEASDPVNVKITASSGQLAAAFAAAGWYRADEIDLITSARISFDSILGRKYSTAPVSNLYLYGRKEDFAFERPGTSVRERDHARFWDTGTYNGDNRTVWVGGATRDIKVELSPETHLPTHKIASDVDAERKTVLDELVRTGWVIAESWESNFGKPTEQRNSLGDIYFTDGRRIVLTLANIPVFTPLTTQVRGRMGARLAQIGARVLRSRLPREGRRRAAERQRAAASISDSDRPASPPDD